MAGQMQLELSSGVEMRLWRGPSCVAACVLFVKVMCSAGHRTAAMFAHITA